MSSTRIPQAHLNANIIYRNMNSQNPIALRFIILFCREFNYIKQAAEMKQHAQKLIIRREGRDDV